MSAPSPALALESRTTFRWLTIAVVVGLVFAIAGLWTFGFVGIFTALLWAMACLAAGGAIGFLFGIPRVLQRDPPVPSEEETRTAVTATGCSSIRTWSRSRTGSRRSSSASG